MYANMPTTIINLEIRKFSRLTTVMKIYQLLMKEHAYIWLWCLWVQGYSWIVQSEQFYLRAFHMLRICYLSVVCRSHQSTWLNHNMPAIAYYSIILCLLTHGAGSVPSRRINCLVQGVKCFFCACKMSVCNCISPSLGVSRTSLHELVQITWMTTVVEQRNVLMCFRASSCRRVLILILLMWFESLNCCDQLLACCGKSKVLWSSDHWK